MEDKSRAAVLAQIVVLPSSLIRLVMGEDIDGHSEESTVAQRPVRAKPGPASVVKLLGPLIVYAVFASNSSTALWQNVFVPEWQPNWDNHPKGHIFFGFALVQWSLEALPITNDDRFYTMLRNFAKKGTRKSQGLCGFCTYRILEWINVESPEDSDDPDIEPPRSDHVPLDWARSCRGCKSTDGAPSFHDHRSMVDHFSDWESKYDFNVVSLTSIFMDLAMVDNIVCEGLRLLHTVPLFRRRKVIRSRLLHSSPTTQNIRKWIASLSPEGPNHPDLGSQGSKWNGLAVDKVLKFVKASTYLRDIGSMAETRKVFQDLESSIAAKPEEFCGFGVWERLELRVFEESEGEFKRDRMSTFQVILGDFAFRQLVVLSLH